MRFSWSSSLCCSLCHPLLRWSSPLLPLLHTGSSYSFCSHRDLAVWCLSSHPLFMVFFFASYISFPFEAKKEETFNVILSSFKKKASPSRRSLVFSPRRKDRLLWEKRSLSVHAVINEPKAFCFMLNVICPQASSFFPVKILFSPFLTHLLLPFFLPSPSLLLLFFFFALLIQELLLLKEKEHHFLPSVLLDSWLTWDRKNRWTSDFTVHSSGWEGSFLPWKQLSLKDYRWVWREREKSTKIAFRSLWSTIKNLKGEAWKELQVPRRTVYSVTDIMKKEGIWIKYSLSYQILSFPSGRLKRRWKKTKIRRRFNGIFMPRLSMFSS